MPRLNLVLRIAAVAIASPILLLGIIITCLQHPIATVRHPLQRPLRMWMSITDWVKNIPVGYSYWERYEAAAMLDEIVVHHHEDSAS
jgi:hypothetical protein